MHSKLKNCCCVDLNLSSLYRDTSVVKELLKTIVTQVRQKFDAIPSTGSKELDQCSLEPVANFFKAIKVLIDWNYCIKLQHFSVIQLRLSYLWVDWSRLEVKRLANSLKSSDHTRIGCLLRLWWVILLNMMKIHGSFVETNYGPTFVFYSFEVNLMPISHSISEPIRLLQISVVSCGGTIQKVLSNRALSHLELETVKGPSPASQLNGLVKQLIADPSLFWLGPKTFDMVLDRFLGHLFR